MVIYSILQFTIYCISSNRSLFQITASLDYKPGAEAAQLMKDWSGHLTYKPSHATVDLLIIA